MEDHKLPLNPKAVEWFASRGIDPEKVVSYGIYTGRLLHVDNDESKVVPDVKGNVIVWPYFENGIIVNEKYRSRRRDGSRMFWQKSGGKKTFWNVDVLDDPQVIDGRQAVVITEGEPDGLASIDCGYPWAMSVPDGAPAARDKDGKPIPMRPDSELNPADDPKFEYVWTNWDRLAKVKRFILATDGDEQGQRLRDELARRLNRSRCYFISYPSDEVIEDTKHKGRKRPCKDLNEVLLVFGKERVLEILQKAKPIPVSGLYKLSDFPEKPSRVLYDVGFSQFTKDNADIKGWFSIWPGAFVIVSGLPMSGKSALWNQIAFNMAWIHGWRVAIGSFEEDVRPDLLRKLRAFFIRKPRADWTAKDVKDADEFIEEHFVFIMRDPLGHDQSEVTVPWYIDRLTDAVLRHGVNMAITDPWNELDHRRESGQARDEYINHALKDMKDAAHRLEVCMTIISHPTKEGAQNSTQEKPMTMYDISDGAAWANKAELGFVVHRPDVRGVEATLAIRKVKFKDTGKVGQRRVRYDEELELFLSQDDEEHERRAA